MPVLNFYHLKGVVPPDAIYIGRPSKKHGLPGSRWANPFPIREGVSRDDVIDQYTAHLKAGIRTGDVSLEDLASLRGKTLVCYCAPLRCHGHVLEKAAEWAFTRLLQRDASVNNEPN